MGAPKAMTPERIHWGPDGVSVDFVELEESVDLVEVTGPTLRTLMKCLGMTQQRDWDTNTRHQNIEWFLHAKNASGMIPFDVRDIGSESEVEVDRSEDDGSGDAGADSGSGSGDQLPDNKPKPEPEGDDGAEGDGSGGSQDNDLQFMVSVDSNPQWMSAAQVAELFGKTGGPADDGNGPVPDWEPPAPTEDGWKWDEKPEGGEPPKPEHDERSYHEKMPEALAALATGQHLLLWGEAGSGKSTAAMEYAKMVGIDFHPISGNPHLPLSQLIGYASATGWVDGPAATAVRLDELLLFDEVDNTGPTTGASLNMLMANGYLQAERRLDVGDRFRVVMTANTNGNGATSEFVGRFQMDHALKDRVYSIHWQTDYAFERYLVRHTLGLDRAIADRWLEICHAVRRNVETYSLKTGVTMRAVLAGAKALSIMTTPMYRESGLRMLSYKDLLTGRVLAKVPAEQAAKMIDGIKF